MAAKEDQDVLRPKKPPRLQEDGSPEDTVPREVLTESQVLDLMDQAENVSK